MRKTRFLLEYFWFKSKVTISLVIWLAKTALFSISSVLKTRQTSLLSLLVLLLVCGSVTLAIHTLKRFEESRKLYATTSSYKIEELTYEEVQKKLQANLILLEKQPTHQQLLVNTALLYQALGMPQQATEYMSRARAVDPNSPLLPQEE